MVSPVGKSDGQGLNVTGHSTKKLDESLRPPERTIKRSPFEKVMNSVEKYINEGKIGSVLHQVAKLFEKGIEKVKRAGKKGSEIARSIPKILLGLLVFIMFLPFKKDLGKLIGF